MTGLSPEEITSAIREAFERKNRLCQSKSNRASSIGDPCLRRLYYKRVEWEQAEPDSVEKRMNYHEGHVQEGAICDTLRSAGFEIIRQQESFQNEAYNISGHIDGYILRRGEDEARLIEIKTTQPYNFEKVDCAADLDGDRWYKRYVDQLNIYMHMANEKTSLLILKNKANGRIKIFEIEYDLPRVMILLEKARAVNEAVYIKEPPRGIDDPNECGRCEFQKFCCPDEKRNPLQYVDDDSIKDLLDRWVELKPLTKEFKQVDGEVKAIAFNAESDKFLCGGHHVERRKKNHTHYDVPMEIKKPYKVTKTIYTLHITGGKDEKKS